MDSSKSQTEKEMPHHSTGVAISWCRISRLLVFVNWRLTRAFWIEFLQERLTRETSNPGFSQLPFRFAEISKVILDTLVGTLSGDEGDTDTGQCIR